MSLVTSVVVQPRTKKPGARQESYSVLSPTALNDLAAITRALRLVDCGELSQEVFECGKATALAKLQAIDRASGIGTRNLTERQVAAYKANAQALARKSKNPQATIEKINALSTATTYKVKPWVYPPYYNGKGEFVIPDQTRVAERLRAGKDVGHKRVMLLGEKHLAMIGFVTRDKVNGKMDLGAPIRLYKSLKGRQRELGDNTYGRYQNAAGNWVAVYAGSEGRIAQLAARGAPGAPPFQPNPKFTGEYRFERTTSTRPGPRGTRVTYRTDVLADDEQIRLIQTKTGPRYAVIKVGGSKSSLMKFSTGSQTARSGTKKEKGRQYRADRRVDEKALSDAFSAVFNNSQCVVASRGVKRRAAMAPGASGSGTESASDVEMAQDLFA